MVSTNTRSRSHRQVSASVSFQWVAFESVEGCFQLFVKAGLMKKPRTLGERLARSQSRLSGAALSDDTNQQVASLADQLGVEVLKNIR